MFLLIGVIEIQKKDTNMQSLLEKFPMSMKLAANYMPDEFEGNIYHYTSPEGFNSILFGNPDKVIMWASRYDCMNDSSEGTVANAVFKRVCEEMRSNKEITEELYNIVFHVSPMKTFFLPQWKDGKFRPKRLEYDRFICSFSKNKDALAMWNYYSKGNKYEGNNIGFSIQHLKSSLQETYEYKGVLTNIYPVMYQEEEQKKLVRKLLLDLQKYYAKGQETSVRYWISYYLLEWGLVFKQNYFQHEDEVRIVVDVSKKIKDGVVQKRPLEIKYRTAHGLQIPYIELEIRKNTVEEVYIGPLQCDDGQKEVQKQIIKERLDASRYFIRNVDCSQIPVRY